MSYFLIGNVIRNSIAERIKILIKARKIKEKWKGTTINKKKYYRHNMKKIRNRKVKIKGQKTIRKKDKNIKR